MSDRPVGDTYSYHSALRMNQRDIPELAMTMVRTGRAFIVQGREANYHLVRVDDGHRLGSYVVAIEKEGTIVTVLRKKATAIPNYLRKHTNDDHLIRMLASNKFHHLPIATPNDVAHIPHNVNYAKWRRDKDYRNRKKLGVRKRKARVVLERYRLEAIRSILQDLHRRNGLTRWPDAAMMGRESTAEPGSSAEERPLHTREVAGSNPAPATTATVEDLLSSKGIDLSLISVADGND